MMCCSNTGVSLKSSYLWIEWIRFLSNSINFSDCPDYINPWMTMNWIKMSLFILLNIILSVTSDVLCENSGKNHFRISNFQFLFSKLLDRFEGRLREISKFWFSSRILKFCTKISIISMTICRKFGKSGNSPWLT